VLGALAFWLIGMETRGNTIDQIDAELAPQTAPSPVPLSAPDRRFSSLGRWCGAGRSLAGENILVLRPARS